MPSRRLALINRPLGFGLAAALLAFLVAGTNAAPVRIVTTVFPAYAAAKAIAGSSAEVDNLLPNNASAHGYQLAPGDLKKLGSADLIVMNGLGLDDWIRKALKSNPRARVITLSDGLEPHLIPGSHGHGDEPHHDHEAHSFNPHIWLDPNLMGMASSNVLKALIAIDPSQRASYETNSSQWGRTLQAIDAKYKSDLRDLRAAPFVTMHDAFTYLARAYDLRVIGVVETVPDVTPGPRTLGSLLEAMRREKVNVIFGEKGGANRMTDRIARDLGIRTAELDPLESGLLTPTAYEEGMLHNLEVLVRELGRGTNR